MIFFAINFNLENNKGINFKMCKRINCEKCKKPTWTGCGQHIEQALAGVPESER